MGAVTVGYKCHRAWHLVSGRQWLGIGWAPWSGGVPPRSNASLHTAQPLVCVAEVGFALRTPKWLPLPFGQQQTPASAKFIMFDRSPVPFPNSKDWMEFCLQRNSLFVGAMQ